MLIPTVWQHTRVFLNVEQDKDKEAVAAECKP